MVFAGQSPMAKFCVSKKKIETKTQTLCIKWVWLYLTIDDNDINDIMWNYEITVKNLKSIII